MLNGLTHKPIILRNDERKYVIIGSIDHGMEIPQSSIYELISSLDNIEALMMETTEISHAQMHPMSTELLVKASVGQSPIHYLSGNRMDEEIGELVLKYAPQDIAEVFVPCLHVRNSYQLGQETGLESITAFTLVYQGRFGFLDVERTIENYMKVLQYWDSQKLDPKDLDHFSYDFEKFFGDIKEFELWQSELKEFKGQYNGRVAACVGDYHVPFVQDVFDNKKIQAPNWENHIDTRREDKLTPQDADFLKRVYANLEKALKE